MNTSAATRRLTATALAIAAATVLAGPAAHAQRDLLPGGSDATAAPCWSDSADLVTDRKTELAQNRITTAGSHRPTCTGAGLADRLFVDIADVVDTRKVQYAQYRIQHARELAANR